MKKSNKRKASKGISLVELIVAMAVIVIVSVAALSISLSSTVMTNKAQNSFNASNKAEDLLNCFIYADDYAEFENILDYYADGYTADETHGTYRINYGSFDLELRIDWTENTFEAFAYAIESNDEIYHLDEYKKGVI